MLSDSSAFLRPVEARSWAQSKEGKEGLEAGRERERLESWRSTGARGVSTGAIWLGTTMPAYGLRPASKSVFLLSHSAAFSLPLSLLLFLLALPPHSFPISFSLCPSTLLPLHPHLCLRPLPPLSFLMSMDPLSHLPSALTFFFWPHRGLWDLSSPHQRSNLGPLQ